MFSTVDGRVYLRDINAKQACVLGYLRNFNPTQIEQEKIKIRKAHTSMLYL